MYVDIVVRLCYLCGKPDLGSKCKERTRSMDSIIKRMSERVVTQSSRRGFLSKVGKAMLGAAALVIGQDYFGTLDAEAAGGLKCCNHTRQCAHKSCDTGYSNTYTWSCGHYTCHDCFNDTTHKYYCTYVLG